MKHMKTINIPARMEERIVRTTCDLCKKDTDPGNYEIDEVQVSRRHGSYYPDGGGAGDQVEVDICGECFLSRLIPWLESLGVKPVTTEWDH